MLNLLTTTPQRRIGEWMYRSALSWPWKQMKVSGQSHAAAILPQGKSPSTGTQRILGWVTPRTGLDDVLPPAKDLELRPLARPVRSQSVFLQDSKKTTKIARWHNRRRVRSKSGLKRCQSEVLIHWAVGSETDHCHCPTRNYAIRNRRLSTTRTYGHCVPLFKRKWDVYTFVFLWPWMVTSQRSNKHHIICQHRHCPYRWTLTEANNTSRVKARYSVRWTQKT
jgi:hypothetical protein